MSVADRDRETTKVGSDDLRWKNERIDHFLFDFVTLMVWSEAQDMVNFSPSHL